MEINLQNAEEIIFYNRSAQAVVPEFRNLFEQWRLGQQFGGLKDLGKRSVLEFVNSLDPDVLKRLSSHFGEPVFAQKLDVRLVAEVAWSSEIPRLCEYSAYREFCLSVNRDGTRITFWR